MQKTTLKDEFERAASNIKSFATSPRFMTGAVVLSALIAPFSAGTALLALSTPVAYYALGLAADVGAKTASLMSPTPKH